MAMWMQALLWVGAWAGAWYGIARLMKSKGMAGWVAHLGGGVFGFCVSIMVLAIILPTPESTTTTQSAVVPSATTASISVSAGQLFQSYHANEVSADEKYRGKPLLVTGSVQNITKDAFDNVFVNLRTSNEFMPARAQIDDADEHAKAGALHRGQRITIACTGDGMLVGSPMLENCHIK